MALTIYRTPYVYSPAYNQLSYTLNSSNYSQPYFKYICKLYNGSNVLLNTQPLEPRPDGTCLYNPQPILKNYLSIGNINEYSSVTYSTTSELGKYYVVFNEQYVNSGVVVNENYATQSTSYIWMSAAQWEDGKNLSSYVDKYIPSIYILDNILNYKKYVTTPLSQYPKESEIYPICINEKRIASIFTGTKTDSFFINKLVVTTITKSGTNKVLTKTLSFNGSAYNHKIAHIPIGINELNAITWTTTSLPIGDYHSTISYDEDSYYFITFYFNSTQITNSIGFNIVNKLKYNQHYTVMYQNNGSYSYLNMSGNNDKKVNIKSTEMQSYLRYNYDYNDAVFNTTSIVSIKDITLTSDRLNNDVESSEYIDMINSPKIYLYYTSDLTNYNYIPVYIKDASIDYINVRQDKIAIYQITFIQGYNTNISL